MYYVYYLLRRLTDRPLKSEAGVTAIEYALIAGIMAVAIVAGATTVGAKLLSFFIDLAGRFPT